MSYDENILLDTDSYKASHWLQYPDGTSAMFSYLESRGGIFNNTVFFGLQYILKKYFSKPFTEADIAEAEEFYAAHGLPFNAAGFRAMLKKYGGKFPIKIKAVPEGTVVPYHNALVTVESTDPEFYWVVSYLETMLMRVWYPITVATTSWYAKQIILESLRKTSDDPENEINFKLHDFGARGVSSRESAAIGGAAHLVNFMGSDTVVGIKMANEIYHSNMAAFSIPAAEHSSMTILGREGELTQFKRMLTQFAKPGSLVAVVSDSYDLWNAISNYWGTELKSAIIESGATVVIRPDSGNPVEVVSKSLQLLDEKFGSFYNKKGFKVLNNVRLIQGDGVNLDSIRAILNRINSEGYSTTNIAFGMGGALLQKVDRDTQKFAYKCSSATINGKDVEVFKDPITDKGKTSKKGRLDLIKPCGGQFETIQGSGHFNSVLKVVYNNGEILANDSLDEIRKRSNEKA